MQLHGNAELGLSGRQALVLAIEGGLSLKAAAVAVEHAAVFRQKPRSIWVALMASRRSAASPK
jgi:hypothetical protein